MKDNIKYETLMPNIIKLEFEDKGIIIIPLTKEFAYKDNIWKWDKNNLTLSPSINGPDHHIFIRNGKVVEVGDKEPVGKLVKITECLRKNGTIHKLNIHEV